jgi:hypothetical protein
MSAGADIEFSPSAVRQRWWSAVTIALAVGVFAEAVFAGAMLSGAPWARGAHMAFAALLIVSTAAAGLVAALGLRRIPEGLRLGLTLLGLAAGLTLQFALGRASAHGANLLWAHIPLGVALVGLAMRAFADARKLGVPA